MRLGVNGTLMYYKMDFVSLCNVVMRLCACTRKQSRFNRGVKNLNTGKSLHAAIGSQR